MPKITIKSRPVDRSKPRMSPVETRETARKAAKNQKGKRTTSR